MSKESFNEKAKAFVNGLSDSQLRSADERGCRVYCWVSKSDEELASPSFELSIGSPIDYGYHEGLERTLRGQAAIYWADSGRCFEAWQDEPSTLEEIKTGLLNWITEQMPEELREAIGNDESER